MKTRIALLAAAFRSAVGVGPRSWRQRPTGAAQRPRIGAQPADVPQHRPVPAGRVDHRDRRARHAGARASLHDLRRVADRRPVEDRQQRHHRGRTSPTRSTSRRSARSPSRRRTRRSSGSAPANRPTRARRTPARACSSRSTAARRGSSWACPTRITSRASSFIRRIPDIVWVAAMGHLFSRNEERGVFRTTDGGKTLAEGALRRRRHRRDRPRDQPAVAEHPLRRDVREAPHAVAARARRPGHRPLSQRRRRREVAEARRRIADRHSRPHRHRHLSEESEHPLRGRRERESAAGRDGRGDRRLPDDAGGPRPRRQRRRVAVARRRATRRPAAAGPRPRRRRRASATRSTAATTAARRGARRTATTSTSPAARRRTRSISSRSTPAIRIIWS